MCLTGESPPSMAADSREGAAGPTLAAAEAEAVAEAAVAAAQRRYLSHLPVPRPFREIRAVFEEDTITLWQASSLLGLVLLPEVHTGCSSNRLQRLEPVLQ